MGQRVRLDEDERVYLIDLVKENIKLQGSLVSLPIRKLLGKLGDDSLHASKARVIPTKFVNCLEPGCGRILKGGAGIARHTSFAHNRKPLELEKVPTTPDRSTDDQR